MLITQISPEVLTSVKMSISLFEGCPFKIGGESQRVKNMNILGILFFYLLSTLVRYFIIS